VRDEPIKGMTKPHPSPLTLRSQRLLWRLGDSREVPARSHLLPERVAPNSLRDLGMARLDRSFAPSFNRVCAALLPLLDRFTRKSYCAI